MKEKKPVNINGINYESYLQASKKLGMAAPYFSLLMKRGGVEAVKAFVEHKAKLNKHHKRKRTNKGVACGVTCSNGKHFRSIGAAAKYAKAKMWTMSVKMETTGKFVDKLGNEYYRNTPMRKRSNREYFCNTSTVRAIKSHLHHTVQVAEQVVNTHNKSVLSQLATQAKAQIDAGNYAQAIKLCDAMSVLKQLIK